MHRPQCHRAVVRCTLSQCKADRTAAASAHTRSCVVRWPSAQTHGTVLSVCRQPNVCGQHLLSCASYSKLATMGGVYYSSPSCCRLCDKLDRSFCASCLRGLWRKHSHAPRGGPSLLARKAHCRCLRAKGCLTFRQEVYPEVFLCCALSCPVLSSATFELGLT